MGSAIPTALGTSVQFSHSVCLTLCDPTDCSTPGLPVHHQLPELAQTHVHRVGDAIQPSILCRPLLLPPSIFPSITVFSNESVLHIRWPKYWSFSFSIRPSKNIQNRLRELVMGKESCHAAVHGVAKSWTQPSD